MELEEWSGGVVEEWSVGGTEESRNGLVPDWNSGSKAFSTGKTEHVNALPFLHHSNPPSLRKTVKRFLPAAVRSIGRPHEDLVAADGGGRHGFITKLEF